MVQHFKVTIFGDCLPVYDGKRSLYTVKALPVASGGVSLTETWPVVSGSLLSVLPGFRGFGSIPVWLVRLIWM